MPWWKYVLSVWTKNLVSVRLVSVRRGNDASWSIFWRLPVKRPSRYVGLTNSVGVSRKGLREEFTWCGCFGSMVYKRRVVVFSSLTRSTRSMGGTLLPLCGRSDTSGPVAHDLPLTVTATRLTWWSRVGGGSLPIHKIWSNPGRTPCDDCIRNWSFPINMETLRSAPTGHTNIVRRRQNSRYIFHTHPAAPRWTHGARPSPRLLPGSHQ